MNKYYQKTFYSHAVCTGEVKEFTPLYNEITKQSKEFVPMKWPNYGDLVPQAGVEPAKF